MLFISFYSVNGVSMSLFRTNVVLFSPMQGKLTYQGKPAANARIVRHIIWKDDVGEKRFSMLMKKVNLIYPLNEKKLELL